MPEPDENRAFQRDFFSNYPGLWAITTLFDYLPGVFFFAKDRESRFVRMNTANLELYGLDDESDILGKTDRDFHPPTLAEAYLAEDRRVMSSKAPLLEQTWLVPYLDGRLQWFVSSKIPVIDARDEVIGIAGAMRPIATPKEEIARFKSIAPAVKYFEKHFDESTPLNAIADRCGLSLTQFNRLFRAQLQMSPSEYRTALRLQRARSLLRYTKKTIAAVAFECGFCDHSHLTKHFLKATGVNPSAYRKAFGDDEAEGAPAHK